MPPLTRRPPDRRARVLALAADLAEDLAAVELDAVDGEFYWRCCRGDLLEQVEALFDGRPRSIGVKAPPKAGMLVNDGDTLSGVVEPDGVFAYLREGLRFAEDLLALADEAERLYPAVVWRRLLDGERVAMRAAEAEVRRPYVGGGPGDPPSLLLKVFSGAWTGPQVEDEVRRLVAGRPEWVAPLRPERGPGRGPGIEVAVRVDFAFGDQRRAYEDAADGEAPRFPYVEVSVPVPLPPPRAIAREYDALVRGELRWHLALPGGGSRQEKEVAIRTWAIGLLMAAGESFGDAMHAVAGRAGATQVSQARFGQDRQRLVERVPEGRPYLFARDPGGDADAREAFPVALANPAAAESLANPDQPIPPLQDPGPEKGAYT